ncbi:hypothetical protein F9L00_24805 [Brucella anthropi]|uniref:hypothetical protein n=1 Tax=Brucella anthropi TaxID=529 RepID=UPI00124EB78E|nr:hypothetical protein [Brucella anthropi]KAB2773253.1 hypothetical protein F9L00_24805 [Brucella anthropi]
MTTEDDLKALKKLELAGSDFVLIPLNDYVELLNKQRQLAEHQADRMIVLGRAGRSVIERNPEVAYFFMQNLGQLPMTALLKKCRRRFGNTKTPSLSAAYRYWDKVREAQKQKSQWVTEPRG